MIPRRPRGVLRRALLMLLPVLAIAFAGACSAGTSFDPSGPCTTDGQAPGAYPDLEALVPASFDGKQPTELDSGRSCSQKNLGSLVSHGVAELRFAGGLWPHGERSGSRLAVMTAPGLTADWMTQFYETGARAASKTENVSTESVTLDGVPVERIETLNDESFQTVAVLKDPLRPDVVRVALVASDVRESAGREAHEEVVRKAVAALAALPGAG